MYFIKTGPTTRVLDRSIPAWNNVAMNKNVLLLGSVLLIVLAIAMVSLLSRTSSSSSTDVRARAAVVKTLELNGTVKTVNEGEGTLILERVYLSDDSREGSPQDLGTWTVTVPSAFNMASVGEGQMVKVNIDSKTFLISSHSVTALAITPVK